MGVNNYTNNLLKELKMRYPQVHNRITGVYALADMGGIVLQFSKGKGLIVTVCDYTNPSRIRNTIYWAILVYNRQCKEHERIII